MTTIKVSSLEGNSQKLDGGSMFGNASRTVWEKWTPPDNLGRIDLACRALLVEIGDIKILCETGIGAFFEPKLADRYGVQNPEKHLLLHALQKLGWSDADIDYVVLSHLHFDHAGGLLPPYQEHVKDPSKLLFPNATYIVGAEAWKRAEKPHARDRASFIPEIVTNLKNSNRLLIINGKQDLPKNIAPHFDFYISNGHTPGQLLTIIKGAKQSLVFTGDLIPGSPWVHVPITMGYDRYPEMLIDEKQGLYEQLQEDKDIIFFTHDTKMSGATFHKDEKGKYTVAKTYIEFNRQEI